MIWEETPYTILAAMAAGTLVLSAFYVWRRSHVPGVKAATLLMFLGAIYMGAYTVEITSSDLPLKIFGDRVQFAAVSIMPVIWLVYAFQLTGREKWVTRSTLALLSIVPAVLIVLALTNEYHGLVWSRIVLSTEESSLELDKTYSVGYWAFVIYSYILIPLSSVLLIQTFFHRQLLHRQKGRTLLFTVFLPLMGSIMYLIGAIPTVHPSSTLFFPVVVTLIMAYFFVGWRMADIVPTAWGAVIHSIGDSVIVLDNQNCIMDLNPAAQQLAGRPPSALIGTPVDQVWPELFDYVAVEGTREVVLDHGEDQRIYDVEISPVTDWRGLITSRVIVARDITERKRVEKQIKASLREKEVLLREIHHRVKNNLQIISSLLSLQSRYIKDKKYKEMLKESQNRVRSMALIHEKLYQSESLADIDFKEYITDMVHGLVHSYEASEGEDNITLTIDVRDVSLAVDTAVPCGLIINELVSNSLKHAFPGRKGEITVRLCPVDGVVKLTVSDNGVGISEDIDFKNTESLGLRLVTILAEDQLEGEISMDRSKGTTFHIEFGEVT